MARKKEIKEIDETMEMAPVEEAPEVTVTETSATVTPPTSRTREWMQSKFPDEAWDDDAMLDDRVAQHLGDTDTRLKEYEESDGMIADILAANPEFALAIQAMGEGMPAKVAIRRYMGDLLAEPMEGDDDFEAWREASEKFLAEKKAAEDEIATRNTNLEKSDVVLKDFVEANFPTEDEQIEFVEYLRSTLRNIGMGEISEAFLDMMLKAYKHDNDVEDAKEAGAIEARNEKITAKRIKANEETDGLPKGGGSSPIITEEEPEEDDFIGGVLRDYRNRRK
jgi:hypothetical protein